MTKAQKIIICILIGLYFLGGAFLYAFQRQLTYFPNDSDFYACGAFSDAERVVHGKTRMYLLKKDPTRLVIFYHGNAASACSADYIRDVIDSSGASVLIPEYSGYAGDSGLATKDNILSNVRDVVGYLSIEGYDSVTLVGESLGTAMASYHASLLPPAKLALVSPFSSMADIAKIRFRMYPSWIVTETYDNMESLKDYRNKLLIIHGDSDDVVPQMLSEKLFSLVSSEDKKRILVPGGEHEYIWSANGVREAVRDFIR